MVGIISFLSTRYAQFAYKYINLLERNNTDYEFIFWNREGDYTGNKSNWISYDKKLNSFQPFYKKVLSFIGFSYFMRKQIKKKKYEKLVILTSQTAIPLIDLLLRKYKKNYIYDYRDITYENFKIYKILINKLVDNSRFTAISSKGFLNNINSNDKTILSHNCRNFKLQDIIKTKSNKIRVVYWGMVRQLEMNYKICDLFASDDRFELVYHGAGFHNELKEYCDVRGYSNIKITGKYELDEIEKFARETDIVLNVYENDKTQTDAITVKFYDSIQYGIPMMVLSKSHMAKLVNNYSLGFVLDFKKERINDYLFEEYKKFDYEEYQINRKKIFDIIKKDDEIFEKNLIQYICEEKND